MTCWKCADSQKNPQLTVLFLLVLFLPEIFKTDVLTKWCQLCHIVAHT